MSAGMTRAWYAIPHLREWRVARLMSQEDLAKKSGVAVGTISPLENGRISASLRTLRKLATALKLTPEELLKAEPPKVAA